MPKTAFTKTAFIALSGCILPILFCCAAVAALGCTTLTPTIAAPTASVTTTAIGTTAASGGYLQALWTVTRGGPNTDEAWGVTTDAQGNVYLAGHDTISKPLGDVFLAEYTPDGGLLWTSSWGGPGDKQAYVVVERGGVAYVGGRTQSGTPDGTEDMALLAFRASDGALLWSRTWAPGHGAGYGYDEADGIVVDGDAIYVAGWATVPGSSLDLAVLKYDLQGNLLWSRTWGTSGWDEANGQIAVDSGHIYVAGRYNASGVLVGGDALLAAFSKQDGAYAWHVTYSTPGLTEDAYGLTMDGGYLYSVGVSSGLGVGDHIFLLKYGTDGALSWAREWGGSGSESARVVEPAGDGSVVIAGKTTSVGNGSFDVVVLRYGSDGALLSELTWGGAGADESHGLVIRGDTLYIAGETTSLGAGKQDALLLAALLG